MQRHHEDERLQDERKQQTDARPDEQPERVVDKPDTAARTRQRLGARADAFVGKLGGD